MSPPLMRLIDVHVTANGYKILRGIDLDFEKGKVYAILGPNGSGKSTIAKIIMGFPNYKLVRGDILFNGQSIQTKEITDRVRLGIAYAFQHPPAIKGVRLDNFLCKICFDCEHWEDEEEPGFLKDPEHCRPEIIEGFRRLNILNLVDRDINDQFSGGEIKRSELLQVISMKPKIFFLDEPDSGLDFDSLKLVGQELKHIRDRKTSTMVVITHNRYILDYLQAERIDIISEGTLKYTGGMEILPDLERLGYAKFLGKEAGVMST